MPLTALLQTAGSASALSQLIHNELLQMLGVALLEVELCQRLWDRENRQAVLEELDALLKSAETVDQNARPILALLPQPRPAAAPQKMRHLQVVGSPADEPELTTPEDLMAAIEISILEVELCRALYAGHQSQEALITLHTVAQRLSQVTTDLRGIMDHLRRPQAIRRTG
ncbi:MAG: hypothetical protein U0821_26900 [Chloroflexota bacterium]